MEENARESRLESKVVRLLLEQEALFSEIAQIEANIKRAKTLRGNLQKKISRLRDVIRNLEREVQGLTFSRDHIYPLPDYPSQNPLFPKEWRLFPETSGVYFAWNGNKRLNYVGKSKNLRMRFAKPHHAVTAKHAISFVLLPVAELYFAEAYYIGVLRPTINIAKPPVPKSNSGRLGNLVR